MNSYNLPPNYPNRIGHWLKKKGISQNWLAKATGLTPNTINNIVNHRTNPKWDILYKIADAIKIDVIKLMPPNEKAKKLFYPLTGCASYTEANRLNRILLKFHQLHKEAKENLALSDSEIKNLMEFGKDSKPCYKYLLTILEQDDLIQCYKTDIKLTTRGKILLADEKPPLVYKHFIDTKPIEL